MARRRFWQWVEKGVGLQVNLNCKFLNKPSKGNPMNDNLIPLTPLHQNPMADLLARLNSQDRLNEQSALLQAEMTALLRGMVETQKSHSETLSKIQSWIDSQQQ